MEADVKEEDVKRLSYSLKVKGQLLNNLTQLIVFKTKN